MSSAMLVVVVGVALAGLAVVVNQVMARLALVEVTLTEGLPPGHRRTEREASAPAAVIEAGAALEPGVHIFLSRSCHACQRLAEEMTHRPIGVDAPLTLHYVDRPRPFARDLATQLGADLAELDQELAHGLGADPLPYTIAVGAHGLTAGQVTPTVHDVVAVARNAGHTSVNA